VARLAFSYQGRRIEAGDPRGAVALPDEGLLIRRDRNAEQLAGERLLALGFRIPFDVEVDAGVFDIASTKLPAVVRTLLAEGWQVEAEGRLHRRPGRFDITVQSGIDWFDLSASVDFGGVSASLPELLRALRRGEKTIVLGDGSLGMLPEEWLGRYGLLAEMGTVEGERLRFRRSQTGLLDALVSAQPEAQVDEIFARARQELGRFEGVAAQKAPPGFGGELRPYQEVGVGWFEFLRRFGFGGCLADDMGLGKTIQILALLEQRRTEVKRPSLVVVPKSLVWNWQQEAARFAPGLRCLAHVGPGRATAVEAFAETDLVVTTYGTLRSDVGLLAGMEFDYLILDEAQAIKNPSSESAKAARLLRGQHRLALSGTPIENHLGELWSLFEFLNPGMLGSTRAFEAITGRGRPGEESLVGLARALRPFILRRTKAEVAPELPPKHEETILCELDAPQARLYRELREHYRARLLKGAGGGEAGAGGGGGGKIQVLEALLRLRQAACHPGLIDPRRADEPCAKLDVLLPRLAELRAEGHKALVFSQFTSFLALVRARLDADQVVYEYLDGQVEDRAERVARFQNDPQCPLFLISLKAGGTGLNLTAADYVFILDPWWNPAVEAQAIDRTHRIGQERQVFVYRLLCRDTVEEKVAALQESKRGLAESIINNDQGFVRGLDRETLEILLS
jgi:SNF2 family DNA or RNA helicase